MPRKAATTTPTTADEYKGPASNTRGAKKAAIAAANPIAAPAPVAAQSPSPIPATRATRCTGTVRAAVKKQTKAAKTTKPKRKTTSTRKAIAAVKTADAPSPAKARATRAAKKAVSGNAVPTPHRQLPKQPSHSADAVVIDNDKNVNIVDNGEAKSNDVPPLPSRGRKAIKPAAAAPLPTNPKTPTRRSKKSNPLAVDEKLNESAAPTIPLAAGAVATTTAKVPPLPSRKKRAVAPAPMGFRIVAPASTRFRIVAPASTRFRIVAPASMGFRIVEPRPDTPVPDNTSTPARRRANVNVDKKTLSPRDQNVAAEEDVKPIVANLREVSQDLGDIKHSGNENMRPVFEGANAIVDAFNHAGRANDRARPRHGARATGKAKANPAKEKKTVPPLPSRKAPAPQAAAAASSSGPPPLPFRPRNDVPPLPYRPRNPPSGAEKGEASTNVEAGAAASGQQAPAGSSHKVVHKKIKFRIKVKVEEKPDGKLPPTDDQKGNEEEADEEETDEETDDEETDEEDVSTGDDSHCERERQRIREWYATLPERRMRTSNWVASVNEARQNPGKRRREDDDDDEVSGYDPQDDRDVDRLAKKRRMSVGEGQSEAECADEDTPAKSISQAEKTVEFVKSKTGSWGCWSDTEGAPSTGVAEDADREESQEI